MEVHTSDAGPMACKSPQYFGSFQVPYFKRSSLWARTYLLFCYGKSYAIDGCWMSTQGLQSKKQNNKETLIFLSNMQV